MIRKILLMGEPSLYEKSLPIVQDELMSLKETVGDLHDTLMEYRRIHKCGRAISAPQIGLKKRLIYMHINEPLVFINPRIEFIGYEKITVFDECMSFPNLLVRVKRFKRCRIKYRDMNWRHCEMLLEGSLSELFQHEYDHLEGILATMRADGVRSLLYKGFDEASQQKRKR